MNSKRPKMNSKRQKTNSKLPKMSSKRPNMHSKRPKTSSDCTKIGSLEIPTKHVQKHPTATPSSHKTRQPTSSFVRSLPAACVVDFSTQCADNSAILKQQANFLENKCCYVDLIEIQTCGSAEPRNSFSWRNHEFR